MIDLQQMAKDYAECYADKTRMKFIEKYFYTFNASSGKKTPFRLFPRQKAFLTALANNRNVVAIKPRQCGISTLTSAWVVGQCAFADKDAPETVLCIANKLEQAQELIIKIRDFLLQVPRWYWGDDFYSVDPNSDKNTKSIFVKDSKSSIELFNGCRIIARSSGPNAARGISAVSVLVLDEAAFIEEGSVVYSTASATMASNPNSKTVMVSTPNGKDELYYTTYRQAMSKENNFIAVEFHWYQDPRFNKNLKWYKKYDGSKKWDVDETIDKEGNVPYNEERWRKLERDGWKPTSPWYEEMCKSFNNDSMKIAQELDVSFMGSSDNVVAPEFIEMQLTMNVREPMKEFKDPMVDETWFWKEPIDGHRYVLACLPQGEEVITQRGLVKVEDVKDDDLLLTKEGEYTKIKRRMVREVKDENVIKLRLAGLCEYNSFTWNHPIYASSNTNWVFDFINAEDVNVNDWVQLPIESHFDTKHLGEDILISEDKKTIYFKVVDKVEEKYSGKVFNFETVSESHTFCCRGMATHNCDPSRGTSADQTAIEIIDMDGRDDNGLPIIEQVGEYVGKKLGDDIGALVYQYATLFNNAYVVVDATGGQGDAAILTLINLGYKNLYYEDGNQKTYTVQNSTKFGETYTDRLPGFHFQGNRYPVLANFAGLVRNNEFKIRSNRVINELDTWIFKGDTGRMDHQSGSHDDTICALAMGLFVMQYSLNKLEASINKDKAILKAYRTSSNFSTYTRTPYNGPITPQGMPPQFISERTIRKTSSANGSFMWLFAGYF